MIRFRAFRNSDPPAIAEIWRSQPPERGLMQPVSADLLEQLVFSKPYFDREGFIVAVDGDVPVGFVHAAFGPSEDEQGLSTQLGVTCLVMVRNNYQRQGIGAQLLAKGEEYLRSRGAQVLYAGSIRPLNAFYLGLYGGSELPGVLDSDEHAQRLFETHGYQEIDRCLVLQLQLSSYRTAVDRQQMQLRRRTVVRTIDDPPSMTWWEACTHGSVERTRYELVGRDSGKPLASATFWSMQPLASSWGVHAAGLTDLVVDEAVRRQGYATCLLGEVFRQMQTAGVAVVEAQTMQHNLAALGVYRKFNFALVDQGAVYRKVSDGAA